MAIPYYKYFMHTVNYFEIGGERGHIMAFCGTARIVMLNNPQGFLSFGAGIQGG
jgi:hypothetical protein